MVQDLKSLIEKINQEGVQAAEEKSKEIETAAKKKAEAIIEKAEKEAASIVSNAKEEAARAEKSGEASLNQAARNVIISLEKEIISMLDKIVLLEIRDELDGASISKIIASLIKNYKSPEEGDVIVSMGKEDLEGIEKGLLAKLKEDVKKNVILQQSDEIQGGFIISYDSGRSHYDFTDKGLAGYMSAYLRPRLRELLRKADSEKKG